MRTLGMALCWAVCALGQQPAAVLTDPKDLAVLEGRVLGVDGTPIRKAILTMQADGGKPGEMPQSYGATSGADGKFIFDGVEPGRYRLRGRASGYLQSNYSSKKNSEQGTPLTLAKGQHMSEVSFVLTPQASVSGRALDDDGDPVAFAQVFLLRSAYANGKRQFFPTGNSQTDDQGEFKCTGLTAGRYFLSVTPNRNAYIQAVRKTRGQAAANMSEDEFVQTFYPGVTEQAAASVIEVTAGRNIQALTIWMRKSPVFHIKGTVVGTLPDSATGRRVQVSVAKQNDSFSFNYSRSSLIGKNAEFELDGVTPGSYDLIATGTQGQFHVLGRQPIQVGNQNMEGVALVLQPPGTIKGIVMMDPPSVQAITDLSTLRFSLGLSHPGAMPMNLPNTKIGKEDGSFTLENISPEKYAINIFGNPEGTYLKAAQMGDVDVLANDLDFTGGVSTAPLTIVLSTAAGEIDGTVQDEKQQPAPGAILTLVPDPAEPKMNYRYKMATADQNGQFSLKSLAPGKYRLYAWEDLENGSQYDPDFMRPLEGLGVKVSVDENGKQALTVPRISTAQVEAAKAR